MTATPVFNFRHGGKLYRLTLEARFVCAIEDEIGPLPVLARRFAEGAWRLSEVITLMQMFLQQSGRSEDFYALGDALIAGGLDLPLCVCRRFFSFFDAAAAHGGEGAAPKDIA